MTLQYWFMLPIALLIATTAVALDGAVLFILVAASTLEELLP